MNKFDIKTKYRDSLYLKESSCRTDLAIEACEFALEKTNQKGINNLDGIESEESSFGSVNLTSVRVINENGSQLTGKPIGSYYTFDLNGLASQMDNQEITSIIEEMTKIIRKLVGVNRETILVIGLGNWNVTPDALGPRVANKLNVSRHIKGMLEANEKLGMKTVCALAPGVLGITGIETYEVVKGVVEHVKPDVVIAIDSLASRKLERICTSLQICDTGIAPGSGVGNRRMELSQESLGVPVIAIGIPTVVDAMTMAGDVIEAVLEALDNGQNQNQNQNNPQNTNVSEEENNKKMNERREKKEALMSLFTNMPERLMVTPKEIDEIIDDTAALVSRSLNIALGIDTLYN